MANNIQLLYAIQHQIITRLAKFNITWPMNKSSNNIVQVFYLMNY